MITRSIIFLSLLIAASQPCLARPGSDGYYWYKAEYVKDRVAIRVFLFKDRKALLARYNELGGVVEKKPGMDKTPRLNAFSGFNNTTQTCDIFAMDPAVEYHPEDFGHELLHCFFGNWHPYL